MLCAIARLDEEATRKLISLQKTAAGDSACPKLLHGHITIATYLGEKETRFIQDCKESLAGISAFTVSYRKIEVLEETSIIIAAPEKTGMLESVHQIISKQYEDALDKWTKPDKWYPHTTLLFRPDTDLYAICRNVSEHFVPFPARVCSIEFSRVLPSGFEIIDRLDLPDRQKI